MTLPPAKSIINFQLEPSVQVLWRSKTQIQIGLSPNKSLCLPSNYLKVIKKLNEPTGTEDLANFAKSLQISQEQLDWVIQELVNRNFLIHVLDDLDGLNINQNSHLHDAYRETNTLGAKVNNRLNAGINIFGAGRLGITVALLLGNSGFANLRIVDHTEIRKSDLIPWGASRVDLGLRRDQVTQTILERIHPGQLKATRLAQSRIKPTLNLYFPDPVADFPFLNVDISNHAMANDAPFLVAGTSPTEALVSNVIIPGQTSCLRCFHLNQADRDPVWPQLISQLIGRQIADPTPTALVLRSALFIFELICNYLDFGQNSNNLWHQLTLNSQTDFLVYPHVDCGCQWPLTNDEVA